MNELITVRYDEEDHVLDLSLVDQPFRKGLALLIPTSKDESYVKHTTQAIVNTMWRMTTALRPNKSKIPFDELQTSKTDDGIDENLMMLTRNMGNLMQKIIHSHSWREGTFESFDKLEFKRQLEYMAAMLN